MEDVDIKDPYAVLGVTKSATNAEIKKAYRALVKKLHPDINPGNAANEARFKAVSSAYALLSDPERRRRFDAGEIDASGAEMPERPFYRDHARTGQTSRYSTDADFGDLGDIFARAFGQRAGGTAFRGADIYLQAEVSFLDAANGARRRITTPHGEALDLSIPPGIEDGTTMRLPGRGQAGHGGGPPGDTLVRISVAPHSLFRRDGSDIHIDLPISVDEAVLGGAVAVPTISGRVSLTIPPGSSGGRMLRLKGKGIAARGQSPGDQLVMLVIVVPSKPDDALRGAMEDWRKVGVPDPRASWKGRN
jgi:DnaJ-class molecular chaperone